MLVIRLRRGGKTHQPHYRIVVQEKRSKVNGKYIESLGHFHPIAKEDSQFVINKDRILYWLGLGAKPSDTLTNLLVKADILPATEKISHVYSNKKKLAKDKSAKEKVAPQAAKVDTKSKATESTKNNISTEESSPEEKRTETPLDQSESVSKTSQQKKENDLPTKLEIEKIPSDDTRDRDNGLDEAEAKDESVAK